MSTFSLKMSSLSELASMIEAVVADDGGGGGDGFLVGDIDVSFGVFPLEVIRCDLGAFVGAVVGDDWSMVDMVLYVLVLVLGATTVIVFFKVVCGCVSVFEENRAHQIIDAVLSDV